VRSVAHNAGDELADMWLMKQCRHAVVANSSFSWWGAWLATPNENRKVYAPADPGWPIKPASGWRLLQNALERSATHGPQAW
jgi:Glycosyl transferase family 11